MAVCPLATLGMLREEPPLLTRFACTQPATELHAQLEAWYDQHLNSIRRVREPLADCLLEKNPAAGTRIKVDGDGKELKIAEGCLLI